MRTDELRRGVDSSVCESRESSCVNGLGSKRREPVIAGTPDTAECEVS